MARSRKSLLKQKTLSLFDEADFAVQRVKPDDKQSGLRDFPAQTNETTRAGSKSANTLMEQALSSQNMREALKRVERNKGASGCDGMRVEELRPYLLKHWKGLKASLLSGTYRPKPVRRVEIPKPAGGVRLLGIPCVLDRLIQQAVLQILTPVFDPHFSPSSYGFRPGKRGHDAVRKARDYVLEGYEWVVDIDLEKFFDRVNHDMLLARVARRVSDKVLLGLIRQFLESGVLINGVVCASEEGTPQGGPLSPLLSNIVLDDLDKELESRGHKFVRYADDCNIYVRSLRAGERVKSSITSYLSNRLHLRVNESKSAVAPPWERKFLGFSLLNHVKRHIRLAPQSSDKVKDKIRALTQRSRSVSMSERILKLNEYLGGWLGYFALAETPSFFRNLDGWIRRRLRLCLWKQWKHGKTRARRLRALGLSEHKVLMATGSCKGYWRTVSCSAIHEALNNAYWRGKGYVALYDRYLSIRQSWRTAVCGPACTVV